MFLLYQKRVIKSIKNTAKAVFQNKKCVEEKMRGLEPLASALPRAIRSPAAGGFSGEASLLHTLF